MLPKELMQRRDPKQIEYVAIGSDEWGFLRGEHVQVALQGGEQRGGVYKGMTSYGKAILYPHIGEEIIAARKGTRPNSWHHYCWREGPQSISREMISSMSPVNRDYHDTLIANSVFMAKHGISETKNENDKKVKSNQRSKR